MKKVLSVLLIAVMLFSLAGCGGNNNNVVEPTQPDVTVDESNDDDSQDDSADAGKPTSPRGSITVGSTTEMTGDWIQTFSNIAADNDVLRAISGYSTTETNFLGEFVINETAVKSYDVVSHEDGSKTYTFTINEGLMFSDGSPITAYNYVAGALLWDSPFIAEMNGNTDSNWRMKGWSDYSNGRDAYFSGFRLIDDYTFSVTIDSAHLPYYYEYAMVQQGPTHMEFWLGENIEIISDENGSRFATELTVEEYKEVFEKARFNPLYPSSGPYVVQSYDEATKTVVLRVNPNFAGDFSGQTPLIETLIFKRVLPDTMMDELATGSVDLLEGVRAGDEINAGLDVVDTGAVTFVSYPRAGYGKLTFVCDFGPTQFPEVRHAVAHLLDRNDFVRQFTGGFGTVVNGPYGEGQWFYQETRAELNARMNQYPYSLESAIEVLEAGGWVHNADGSDYTGTGIRHKLVDGEYMPLVLEWSSSEQNPFSDQLVVSLQENPDVAAAGMVVNQTTMSFGELINYYVRDASQGAQYGVPTYHIYNLASGFTPLYDLSRTYSTDPAAIAQGRNPNFIIDPKLEGLAQDMVLRDGSDREGFKEAFIEFIVYWNSLLPDLPLYSNTDHDFFNEKIQNWNNNSMTNVPQAVLYAWTTE